ncbi:MAG: helix-turn-helix domain-containing protein [Chitinophagaceae bacterium]|nr:helix-turn-helix domain-containing protein [Chitinophagaceae bacterium]
MYFGSRGFFYKNIGDKIRIKRQTRGIERLEIAAKLGISENAYGKIERGETSLTIERLKDIADILETSIAELIDSAIFYNVKNGNHSPVALHNSTLQVTDDEQSKSIQKLVELIPVLIEKQNHLMDRMITFLSK